MRLLKVIFLSASILLAACATKRTDGKLNDYVEVDNPALTMSPTAPAKIWVPRSYVEKGVPRGGDLVKMGSEKVMDTFGRSKSQSQPVIPQQPAAPEQQPVAAGASSSYPSNRQTAASQPIPAGRQTASVQSQSYTDRLAPLAPAVSTLKPRIAVLELGKNDLTIPFYDNLRRSGIGTVIDPVQTAFLAQVSPVNSDAEKAAFATRLQQDYGANVLIYLSAPDGVASGKAVVAEVYDTMGGGLLRKFDASLSFADTADQTEKNAAIASALASFNEKIKELVSYLPWYGHITVVEGNRAYIAAGRETGICGGQVLRIYHNGKFMKGLGYAPGELVGTMVIQGFVGTNGSFGAIRDGQGVQPLDVVAVD